MMRRVRTGGGWPAVRYTFSKAREAGGLWKLWKAMRSKNACKTCALGMGGQQGGMANERGVFPEVCKKSLQAMVADMQGAVKPEFFKTYSIPQLQSFSPRELETSGRLTPSSGRKLLSAHFLGRRLCENHRQTETDARSGSNGTGEIRCRTQRNVLVL